MSEHIHKSQPLMRYVRVVQRIDGLALTEQFPRLDVALSATLSNYTHCLKDSRHAGIILEPPLNLLRVLQFMTGQV